MAPGDPTLVFLVNAKELHNGLLESFGLAVSQVVARIRFLHDPARFPLIRPYGHDRPSAAQVLEEFTGYDLFFPRMIRLDQKKNLSGTQDFGYILVRGVASLV